MQMVSATRGLLDVVTVMQVHFHRCYLHKSSRILLDCEHQSYYVTATVFVCIYARYICSMCMIFLPPPTRTSTARCSNHCNLRKGT